MKAKLTIVAEFDTDNLSWFGGPRPKDIITAYNDFYKDNSYEAFEIALKDENFKVVAAHIEKIK